jgi:hypothetical protein
MRTTRTNLRDDAIVRMVLWRAPSTCPSGRRGARTRKWGEWYVQGKKRSIESLIVPSAVQNFKRMRQQGCNRGE